VKTISEAEMYEPIRQSLDRQFNAVGKTPNLEIVGSRGPSETFKRGIPKGREIIFRFLNNAPT